MDLGPDQALLSNRFLPAPVVMDDGSPEPAALVYRWQFLSGPAAPVVTEPDAVAPLFTFPLPGTYELNLTVSDGELSTSDAIRVTVPVDAPGLANEPPEVDAIPGQTLVSPSLAASLAGSFSDDGRGGQPPTASWRQLSGPPGSFSSTTGLHTVLSLTEPGDYLVEFAVNDGEFVVRVRTVVRL
ncbi:MAG: hypothetical protein GWO24_19750, partial [Akkermansiaceae bacterium]|nr:hypothetical protein [Akkermansiaceae bacterium]